MELMSLTLQNNQNSEFRVIAFSLSRQQVLVSQQINSNQYQLEINSLPAGFYFLKSTDETGNQVTNRFRRLNK